MITVMTPGHYRVTASDGTPLGTVDGNSDVGFQVCTADGRRLGRFPVLAEALEALHSGHGKPS